MTEKLIYALNALAEELKADEAVIRYKKAKESYLADEATHEAIREYNVQSMIKQEEERKEEKDQKAIDDLEKRLDELMEKIQNSECMKEMKTAEVDLDELFQTINGVISNAINPQSGCSGSCSSCGGCH